MLAREVTNQLPELQEVELSIIVLVQWAHKLVNGSRVPCVLERNRKTHSLNKKHKNNRDTEWRILWCVFGYVREERRQGGSWHRWRTQQLKHLCNISRGGLAQESMALSPSSGHGDANRNVEFSTVGNAALYPLLGLRNCLLSVTVFLLRMQSAGQHSQKEDKTGH